MIQSFCLSVLGVKLSVGAIQKIIDRVSKAIKPHYEAIRGKARSVRVNHVDKTTLRCSGKLHWLWVMANKMVAFFMVHSHRSHVAFKELIGLWEGILVSDGFGIYQKRVHLRQSCLAHLVRRAKGLSEGREPELAKCGAWARDELRWLCKMAKGPPTCGEWNALFARLCRLIALYRNAEGEAGRFVRHLEKEMSSLLTFLVEEGVEPTNNLGERMLCPAVLWRKLSRGTKSDKGNRWFERILSLKQTCRLQGKSSYSMLVDAMTAFLITRNMIWSGLHLLCE